MLRDGEVFWQTRPSGKPGDTSKQTMTIEPVADGIEFTTVMIFGSTAGMTTTYVTKLDGAEVPVYSAGKVVMRLRGKKTGPNTYGPRWPARVGPAHPRRLSAQSGRP